MAIISTKEYYPVSLPEIKKELKVDTEDEDIKIGRLIKSATQEAENIIGMSLAYTKNVLTIPDYTGDTIEINEGMFQTLESVVLDDDSSVGWDRVIDEPYKFKIELLSSISTDLLTVTFYTGFLKDSEDVQNFESVRDYIFIRVIDKYGPEGSSYQMGSLKYSNRAENLLNGLKGYY